MQALLWPIITWLLQTVVIKFIVFSGLLVLLAFIVPVAVDYITHFISTEELTSTFSAIPAGVWYFWDYFLIDFGLPYMIVAYIARFLIRRLPFIG
ncbi:membrane protein [Betaproteobacteria bacterium]|nr:membrane protein [Betaproteobacteria bacterium]